MGQISPNTISVTVTGTRRLVDLVNARRLAGNWDVSYTAVVPTVQATTAQNQIISVSTSNTAFNNNLKAELQSQGLSANDVSSVSVSSMTGTTLAPTPAPPTPPPT